MTTRAKQSHGFCEQLLSEAGVLSANVTRGDLTAYTEESMAKTLCVSERSNIMGGEYPSAAGSYYSGVCRSSVSPHTVCYSFH